MNDRDLIIKILLQDKEKEYRCHIQFVEKIGIQLAERYDADPKVVSAACLLHDIGRNKETEGESHEETGARIAAGIISDMDFTDEEKELIINCVKNHGGKEEPSTIEEKIVITADSASKILYHEAFMLMCRKKTYSERMEWGLKYLEKGFSRIQFDDYRDELQAEYESLNKIYSIVDRDLTSLSP